MLKKSYIRFFRKNQSFYFYKNILKLYKNYLLMIKLSSKTQCFNMSLGLNQPKRQLYTDVYLQKKITLSTGVILKKNLLNIKFYKRTVDSNSLIILFLQKIYKNKLKFIYFLIFKNFTLRLWAFLLKFWTLIEPQIFIFIHKYSINPTRKPLKRIKRKILKLLKKQ